MKAKIIEKDLKAWVALRAHPKGKSVGDGLIFRASPQGQATWALRYRFNGMPRYLPLGRYPVVSLEAAKVAAKKAWAKIYDGGFQRVAALHRGGEGASMEARNLNWCP